MKAFFFAVGFNLCDEFAVCGVFQKIYVHSVGAACFYIVAKIGFFLVCVCSASGGVKVVDTEHFFLVDCGHNVLCGVVGLTIVRDVGVAAVYDDLFARRFNATQNFGKSQKDFFGWLIIIHIAVVDEKSVNVFFQKAV